MYPSKSLMYSITNYHALRGADGYDAGFVIKVLGIIGAAHLPYKSGVLALIEEHGYTVSPYRVVQERE